MERKPVYSCGISSFSQSKEAFEIHSHNSCSSTPKGLWHRVGQSPIDIFPENGEVLLKLLYKPVWVSLQIQAFLGLRWQIKAKRFLEIEICFGNACNLPRPMVFIGRLIKMTTFLNLPKALLHVGKKDKKGREKDSVDRCSHITD